ncbi:monoamine oxidase [Sphaerotilus hippei]|uniref:Monoamine oxidase n=1 Tax=Sphaerotilus hippei TaxID=744406 RepID=A0A318GXH8_9BURK|nr:FAD-dependent oxidoreductase [Sphaerotilus hippei]PXW94404.1 monoamine oxidase [Sphaerotilus hippei]
MLDIAIIGGGLCGLALAHSLQARRMDWALFEGRDRLGGRVLGSPAGTGPALDLGPTWFWPATQPSITRLIDDLGLDWIEQPDDGRVLLLDDPNRVPTPRAFDPHTGTLRAEGDRTPAQAGALHGGARRLTGGMSALTGAMQAMLPAQRLRLGQRLLRLVDRGDHVELHFSAPEACGSTSTARLTARRVVLALPPRLAAASLAFEPALPEPLDAALRATPTWMATAAKAAVRCDRPAWRDQGLSGNAWVTHPQAVLAEVFDAGPADAREGAALAGFLALGASQRDQFRVGLPMLIESQVQMLFGAGTGLGVLEQHLQDWAREPLTCTALDVAEDGQPGGHPVYGDEALQRPLWQGRLLLGGSETARQGGGYLEGALSAAARLRRLLTEAANDAAPVPVPAGALP